MQDSSAKADRIEIPAGSGSWYEIDDVLPEAPGGVVLYWRVDVLNG